MGSRRAIGTRAARRGRARACARVQLAGRRRADARGRTWRYSAREASPRSSSRTGMPPSSSACFPRSCRRSTRSSSSRTSRAPSLPFPRACACSRTRDRARWPRTSTSGSARRGEYVLNVEPGRGPGTGRGASPRRFRRRSSALRHRGAADAVAGRDVAAVAPALSDRPRHDRPSHAASTAPRPYETQREHYALDERPTEPVLADWMLGAFLLMRRTMLDELGGWDAGYRHYCEDIDLCYRAAQAGWERWYVPAAVVTPRVRGRDRPSASSPGTRSGTRAAWPASSASTRSGCSRCDARRTAVRAAGRATGRRARTRTQARTSPTGPT